ncbi:ABC transporter ATP-binding protein [Levilinea saccharolytica]|uniref:ABC transporter ATP-binding protein n=1 Tax=Levilinea saccharolytica TaxID=229921 RepID=UPI00078636E7|nr:ABC transporter ATP-binding protein [Levilinea saccharolytica]GAP16280.1 ABC-type multidrug transport system, ATPase and permease components [Levilinea saccharolytica]
MRALQKLLRFVKPYSNYALLSLLLLFIMVFLELAIPRLIQRIIDQGIKQNNLTVVWQTSLLMLGISLLSALVAVGNNIFSVRTGESVARDLRDGIFVKVQQFSYGNLDRFTTGNLLVRLTSDVGAVQRLLQVSLRIGTRAPMLMIGSLILMFNTNRQLSLTMVPLLLVTLAIIVVFSIRMEPLFRVVQQKLDRLNTVLQENIAGARLVKAFVRADFESQRFGAANQDFTDRTVRVMQFMSAMSPILTLFVNAGIVTVIWAGGLQSIRGELTVGEIVAFTNYMMTTMTPLTMMTVLSNTWANGIASAQRIHEVLDAEPEVQEAPNAGRLPEDIRGEVVFRDVGFQYQGSSSAVVLDGINLRAEPGQTVAILGATGAGKTTLVNLIPRFYDVTQGQITIDGVDIRSLQQDSLLAHVGIVPQESVLFSGSVRDNIRYGRPQASDEEVTAAARAAQAHEFILELPNGYDTRVEERGVNLSGGQKQRIAIARALITQPKILILDDSTSSVDVETETEIQNALETYLHGRTSFVVAQRISTVLNADKIIVLEKGHIAAQGTHAELMRTSPIYQEIYDSQLGGGLQEAQTPTLGSVQS